MIMIIDASILMEDNVRSKIAEQNKLDTFSLIACWITNISIVFPLLLSRELNNMDVRLVWNERMPFPKHGVTAIVTHFLFVVGFFAAYLGYISPLDIPVDTQDKLSSAVLLCINVFLLGLRI